MKYNSLKEYLKEKLPLDIVDKVNRSFEVVGDIAIIELSSELEKYEKIIGEGLLNVNSNIKVVLKKVGTHGGEFRTQDMDFVAGEKRKETTYLESGVRLRLNVETVYFSARLSTEREELMRELEPNKRVLVMFSGCGPYTFVALKKQPNLALIDSIELNPEGHKYAIENLDLNKNLLKKSDEFKTIVENLKKEGKYVNEKEILKNLIDEKVHFYNGDVAKVVENELSGKLYDVIYMPLPKDAQLFLDSALKVADKNCVVHMYDFVHENEFPIKSEDAVFEAAKKMGREVEIIQTRKVGQYSPRKFRVCCDFIVK